ncbi:unnamed protein product [Cladocopium goreaui]|uniref:Two pore calcium channel protein 1B n=1 Tax=Cladocopium goreaui TaxID=2562237 RepID=A0A9P1BGZ2_9DINO|nr:unnamed protein product [Cladocopium goreaui]
MERNEQLKCGFLKGIPENPRVKAYFETLDLAVHEGTALFHILDNGDGEVTLEEFIDGILRCKGPARAIDQVAMQADLKGLDQKISLLLSWVQEGKVNTESAQLLRRRTERSLAFFSLGHQRGVTVRFLWVYTYMCIDGE